MQRSSRLPASVRVASALAAATLLGGLVAGCSAGFDATSAKPYAPADGVVARVGDLRVLNALVVAAPGADTGLVSMAVVNDGPRADRVTSITSPAGQVALEGDDTLPPGGVLTFSAEDTTATVTGLDRSPGEEISVKISFARAAPVTVRTVVVPPDDEYADLTPSPTPTPTPSPAGSGTATASPSPAES